MSRIAKVHFSQRGLPELLRDLVASDAVLHRGEIKELSVLSISEPPFRYKAYRKGRTIVIKNAEWVGRVKKIEVS